MTTRVSNIRDGILPNSVYIGRAGRGFTGEWGNRFSLRGRTRKEAIYLYDRWFWNKICNDSTFRKKVLELQGKTLLCFCKPLACHGDVIKAFLDEMSTPIAKAGWAVAQSISDRADPRKQGMEYPDEWLVEPPHIKE